MYPRPDNIRNNQLMDTEEFLAKESRLVFLSGQIGGGLFGGMGIMEDLMAMAKWSTEPITLVVSSPGGSVEGMLQIYDTIGLIPAPVDTIAYFCASAATVLFAAGRKRYLAPNARLMLHLPSGQLRGDAREIEIQAGEMKRIKGQLVDLLIECGAKKPKAEILKDIDREFWMGAQQVIDYGLADEVLTVEKLQEILGEPVK